MDKSLALSKAEENAVAVSYDIQGTHVELDLDFVRKYLVKGNPSLVKDEEIMLFMTTCKANNLNPLVSGEVYLIKYSERDAAQMVVGYFAYLRRADKYPDYRGFKAGITVMYKDAKGNLLRDQNGFPIIKTKEGAAVYKTLGEVLVGGWCEVYRERIAGHVERHYMEVALEEYNTGKSNWSSKPATMVRKVAVSQAFRAAFPNEYDGLYTVDEMVASGAIPVEYAEVDEESPTKMRPGPSTPAIDLDPLANKAQKMEIFKLANERFGDDANEMVMTVLKSIGHDNTSKLTVKDVNTVIDKLKVMEYHPDSQIVPEQEDEPSPEEEDSQLPWDETDEQA